MRIHGKNIMLLIVFILLVSGCTNNHYKAYQEAEEKTNLLEQGKSKFIFDLQLNFDEKAQEALNRKEWSEHLEAEHHFDKKRAISQTLIYAKVNDYGFDAKLYQKDHLYYVISPILPKILVINAEKLKDWQQSTDQPKKNEQIENRLISEDTVEQLNNIWSEAYKEKEVTELRNIILTTPDGDVKAKEYQVHLSSEDIKELLLESVAVLSNDPWLNKQMEAQMKQMNLSEKPEEIYSVEKVWLLYKNWLEASDIGPVSFLAYLDRDNYIIEEKLNIEVRINQKQQVYHGLRSFDFNLHIQRWDMGKEMNIVFPEIKQDNYMTLEEMIQATDNQEFPLFFNKD